MPKREPDIEPIDEEPAEAAVPTVGERLRSAREKQGLSLEDLAAQTRIPQRHLESIEDSAWDRLPAPTYTIGFAKNYAGLVGLDRNEIGSQLREEMGGQRFATHQAEVFEPADPARTMPKWLVLGAIAAVLVLVVLMSWLNRRSLDQPAEQQQENAQPAAATGEAGQQPSAQAGAAAQAAAQGPVVLTATAPSWIHVSDQGKTLFQGQLAPGQTFNVPPAAVAPELRAGKPEALRIMVGSSTAPPVGPPGKIVSHVSLKPGDLMRGPGAAPGAAAAPAAAAR